MTAEKGQTKQRLFKYEESIWEKGNKIPMIDSRFQHHSIKVLLLQYM